MNNEAVFSLETHRHAMQGEELPTFLNNFDALVVQPWMSRRELLGLVYGFSLGSLHPDTSFEERQLSRQAAMMDHFVSSSGSSQPSRLAPLSSLTTFSYLGVLPQLFKDTFNIYVVII